VFDCTHQLDVEVSIEPDVIIPASVRGLGKCPACTQAHNPVPVAGIEPRADGSVVLDSILMIPIGE
jgi:hypothetical protein